MDVLIGLLAITDALLFALLCVAYLERYERRHFPSEAERTAAQKRRQAILDNWRR